MASKKKTYGFNKSDVSAEIRMYEGEKPSDVVAKISAKHKGKNVDQEKLKKYIGKKMKISKEIKKMIKKIIKDQPDATIKNVLARLQSFYGKKDVDILKKKLRKYIKEKAITYYHKNPVKKVSKKVVKSPVKKVSKKVVKSPVKKMVTKKKSIDVDELPVMALRSPKPIKAKSKSPLKKKDIDEMTVAELLKDLTPKETVQQKAVQKLYKEWVREKILSHTEMIAKLASYLNKKYVTKDVIDKFYDKLLNCNIKPNIENALVFEEVGIVKNSLNLIKKVVDKESGSYSSIKNVEATYLLGKLTTLSNDFVKRIKKVKTEKQFNDIVQESNRELSMEKCKNKNKDPILHPALCIGEAVINISKKAGISLEDVIHLVISTTDSYYKVISKEIIKVGKIENPSKFIRTMTGEEPENIINNFNKIGIKDVNVMAQILVLTKYLGTHDKLYNRISLGFNM